MRLFLLPISTQRSLIYCQRLNTQISSKTTYIDKITIRASKTWLKWEKAEKGWRTGWQKKVTHYGNKLFERIPHEEWGLKSIPPLSKRRKDEELKGNEQVEVVYPGSVIGQDQVNQALHVFAGDQRQAIHTKWMWGTRSGSQHINFLLENRLLKFTESRPLQLAYDVAGLEVAAKELDSAVEEVKEKKPQARAQPVAEADIEKMLLTQSDGKIISELVDVPELEEQIQRAVKQVEKALKAEEELQEEKQDLDNVNKKEAPKR
ncbi:MAG: hypothetical protein Q9192_006664 [Flavoplaca navasiana]